LGTHDMPPVTTADKGSHEALKFISGFWVYLAQFRSRAFLSLLPLRLQP
jgi:hypothetical protein